MRKLAKTLVLVGLLHPLQAGALGVGDIRLRSALNQPLNAEIPLVLSGSDTLEEVKVTLGSADAFNKAGVERHHFLTQLRFSPDRKPDGSYVVRVKSTDVIREPFLSFVIEVNWPQGRVFREFTVLLDPPATFPEATPSLREAPEIQRREAPSEWTQEEAPQRAPETAVAPVRQAEAAPVRYSGAEYGPVRRDETLWSIARAVNQDPSISQQQMVTALYRGNRNAFAGDVNTLRAGATLKIPDRDSILQLTGGRALGQASRKSRVGVPESTPAQVAGAGEPRGQLKLLAESEAKSKGGVGGTGAEGAQGKAKGELALEVAETVRQENDEFRSRLVQLEQRLTEMQRLLTLREEQIAALQAQQGTAKLPPSLPAVAEPPKPTAQPTPAVPSPPQQAVITPTPVQPATPAQPVTPAPPPVAPVAPVQEAPKPPPVSQPTPAKPVAAVPPATRKPPAAAKLAPAKPPVEPGLMDTLLGHPVYLAVGGIVVLLMAWMVLVLARRRAAMIEETESILIATEKESQLRAQLAAARLAEPAREPVAGARNSFISEFTPSDFDALGAEADEVDPISEADVYLAYGRYKQAEELIRSAIDQHPERDECKLKLLEIHYATENRAAFEQYARELKGMDKDLQPEFWEKVVEMGRELLPDNALFASAAPAKKKAPTYDSSNVLGSLDLSDDLIDDLKRFEIELAEPMEAQHDFYAQEDFVLPSGPGPSASPVPTSPSSAPTSQSMPDSDRADLEFDFSSFGLGMASTEAKQREEEPKEDEPGVSEELENLIAFDFSSPKAAAFPPAASSRAVQPPVEKTLEDILRELDRASGEPLMSSSGEKAPGKTEMEMPVFDFEGLAFDSKAAPLPSMTEEEVEYGASLSDDMADEWETKLDLAKAYSDMEDEESAREILEEVLQRGSERQKNEARGLLAKFSGPSIPRMEPHSSLG